LLISGFPRARFQGTARSKTAGIADRSDAKRKLCQIAQSALNTQRLGERGAMRRRSTAAPASHREKNHKKSKHGKPRFQDVSSAGKVPAKQEAMPKEP
jgi:hypothetical protein